MSKEREIDFFSWLVGFFKKEKVVESELPTQEELQAEAKRNKIRERYRIDPNIITKSLCVQYYYNNEWWYLYRRYENTAIENALFGKSEEVSKDYSLERSSLGGIKIFSDFHAEKELWAIIDDHQKWMNDGHIFMSLDN
jgi:hypothetical protein